MKETELKNLVQWLALRAGLARSFCNALDVILVPLFTIPFCLLLHGETSSPASIYMCWNFTFQSVFVVADSLAGLRTYVISVRAQDSDSCSRIESEFRSGKT